MSRDHQYEGRGREQSCGFSRELGRVMSAWRSKCGSPKRPKHSHPLTHTCDFAFDRRRLHGSACPELDFSDFEAPPALASLLPRL